MRPDSTASTAALADPARCRRTGPDGATGAGAGDAGFLGTKRATASHYAAHVLVQAPMLRDIVTGGAASTLALADDQL